MSAPFSSESPGIEHERSMERRLKLLIEASGALFRSLQVKEVLATVLDLARELILADGYAIWREGEPEREWGVACASGLSKTFQGGTIQGPTAREALTRPLVVEDVEREPLLEGRRQAYRDEGIGSLLAVPLSVHAANTGTIVFYSRQPRRFEEIEVSSALALANLAAAAITTAELYEEQMRLRARAEEGERRAAFLARATAILGSSLDYETTLGQVARLAVPHVADWCVVHIEDSDGAIRQLALAHVDSAKVQWACEIERRYPPDPNATSGVAEVLRSGSPRMLSEIPDELLVTYARDAEHLRLLRQVGFTSFMCVPMPARERVLGTITFVSAESGRRYTSEDLAIAEHLGRRAALAIDNALLFREAERDRAAAEQSLEASRRSELRLRRLVEAGIIGVILGEGERITEANDVFLDLLGYTRQELLEGKLRWPELTAPGNDEGEARAIQEVLSRGACVPFEKEYIRKDGARVPVLLGAALLEPPPRFTWVAFVLDLSERKRLEEHLRESQKLESIGLLAGGIAHDFNNILTGILGNSSLALEDLPPSSPLRPTIESVVHASERAADLTRQLLAYSGKGRFVIQPVDLSAMVRELIPLLGLSISKKVELRLDLRTPLPLVEADSAQLQQLIMNLVLNGAEAIGEKVGAVLVATGVEEVGPDYVPSPYVHELAPGTYVSLEIHDTGCGMDEPTLAHIFDPFFTTKFTGRGLGLAAVLGIIRGHKGDIHVFSRVGQGSSFRVLLPVTLAREANPRPALTAIDLRGTGTILVIDDEQTVQEAAHNALQHYGYRVLNAANGREGVELFAERSGEISLVLLDLTMPVMGGEETLERLRALDPGVRVILSSGYSELEALARFHGAAIAAFVQKPYTAAQLAAKVRSVIERGNVST